MRRALLLGSVVALLGLMLAAPPPGVAATDATGTVRAVVRYHTGSGTRPLAGVEVSLVIFDGSTPSMYACTNDRGVVRFRDVPTGTDLGSATGPAIVLRDECTNRDFLNPRTGEAMTTVYWDGQHGELVLDTFVVRKDETVTLRYVTRTPDEQDQLCHNMWVTWEGTSGADRFTGTSGSDIVNARGGNDTIRTGDGGDMICAGPGDDTLRGGETNDILMGGSGDDELVGGSGQDFLFGGAGNDRCDGETNYECE